MPVEGIHVEIRGAGPPLVLIHGWGMHSGVFDGLAERLSPRRTLHLVDLPGHGRSRNVATSLTLDACVDVETRGGRLTIDWAGTPEALDAPVRLTGPATSVFSARVEIPDGL